MNPAAGLEPPLWEEEHYWSPTKQPTEANY